MHMNSNYPFKLLALAKFFANYQFKSVMVVSCLDLTVQLNFNLTLEWIILTYFLLIIACIDYCMLLVSCLCVILHIIIKRTHQGTRVMQANLVNVILITNNTRPLRFCL